MAEEHVVKNQNGYTELRVLDICNPLDCATVHTTDAGEREKLLSPSSKTELEFLPWEKYYLRGGGKKFLIHDAGEIPDMKHVEGDILMRWGKENHFVLITQSRIIITLSFS